ncbi:bifunctional diaminohydroxyphosphoribosylaminopyrimidine deaminase/5-amino-6-(5-phosphoribosylamino)uracil reductase RibD [Blastomonas sp. SL216]|uniref:bifunctional diaminohydroxyphosphoribosylaminopyrimidine deaminase/5-amino-6-(5-phosphoribosylamino)uracil reductase RibD n=1 Tax=Blastomonas sp. SL216 TaxID=2995169 RepID=UPI002376E94D|nr:bifunctional diaminohydroxyphosphoribosylaminopyrimidine deaminase/5-amino-6-(5-phosphoribosylamino)uracil reductase RibD [Blastomonas sp. SL216]
MIPAVRSDADWMRAAIALAGRGRALSSPNPSVGCVLVRQGRVTGRGWTARGGRPHGEAMALDQAGDSARGATAYVTLEPCAHDSARGPACADLLIAAGLARVVIGCQDPDPRTNGAGIARLRAAGITVETGVAEAEASASLAGFLTRQRLGRPFVTLKLATSLDGQIALSDGTSRWITGDAARAHVHVERAQHDAILVGGGTLRADAPRLDVRLAGLEDRSPRRVLLSRMGDAPPGWTAIAAPEDIGSIEGADWLMVEGGAEVAAAFLARDMVDLLLLYRAPVLIGRGRAALGDIGLTDLAEAHGRWRLDDTRLLGKDRMESYQRVR